MTCSERLRHPTTSDESPHHHFAVGSQMVEGSGTGKIPEGSGTEETNAPGRTFLSESTISMRVIVCRAMGVLKTV